MERKADMVSHYKDLAVYQKATTLRREVFASSKGWPKEERYSLTDQVRRSSRSIGANIAEAWAKRRYPKHFVSKLTDALAEGEETIVWIDTAYECSYIDTEVHSDLTRTTRQICGGLVRMMRSPDSWCGPSGIARETPHPYEVD
ncbi:MAG: hypothetical protein Rubg2KO_29270 [Rubricoccaceae bacterium]